jgi:oligoendopeptidase F
MKFVVTHAPARNAARKTTPKPAASKSLGSLPEWNLADLYAAMDAPTVKRDLDRGENECIEFEKAYKGRLASIAAGAEAGAVLAEAVRRYEAID